MPGTMKSTKFGLSLLLLAFSLLALAQPHDSVGRPGFKLEQSGLIDCSDDEQSCELLTAACLSPEAPGVASIYVVSGKTLRKYSSEFIIDGRLIEGKFLPAGLLKLPAWPIKKIEAMTMSNDGSLIFAITAFNRFETSTTR